MVAPISDRRGENGLHDAPLKKMVGREGEARQLLEKYKKPGGREDEEWQRRGGIGC